MCWITRLVVPLSEISAQNSHWTVSQSSSNDMSTPNWLSRFCDPFSHHLSPCFVMTKLSRVVKHNNKWFIDFYFWAFSISKLNKIRRKIFLFLLYFSSIFSFTRRLRKWSNRYSLRKCFWTKLQFFIEWNLRNTNFYNVVLKLSFQQI